VKYYVSLVTSVIMWSVYTGGMGYREDYEKAAAEVEKLLEESEQLEGKILAARKRMAALAALVELDGVPGKPLDGRKYALTVGTTNALISGNIRRLMKTGRAFTAKEIRAELEQTGFNFAAHSNPLATINAVCTSLTEGGALRRVEKHGRAAWQRTKG
jgi:hypothetical protein